MNQVRLACGLPFWQNSEGQQTNISIALRVTAFVLGIIAIVVGACVITGVPGFEHLSIGCGWSMLALGIALDLVSISIKCIKKRFDGMSIPNTSIVDKDLKTHLGYRVTSNLSLQQIATNKKDRDLIVSNHHLPNEILVMIFGYLNSNRSLNSAALACKTWYYIADQPVFWAGKLFRDYELCNKFFNEIDFIKFWKGKGCLTKQIYLSMSTKRLSSPAYTLQFSHDKTALKNGPCITSLRLFKDTRGALNLLSHGINGTLKFWSLVTKKLEWELDYSQQWTNDDFNFHVLGDANDSGIFIDHSTQGQHLLFINWNQQGIHFPPTIFEHPPVTVENPYSQPNNFLPYFEIQNDLPNHTFVVTNSERQITKVFKTDKHLCSIMIGNTVMVGGIDGTVQFWDFRTTVPFYLFNNNGFWQRGFEGVSTLVFDFGVLVCGGCKGTVNAIIFDNLNTGA